MGSTLSFMEYINDQVRGLNGVTFKKMFGEYGVFLNQKMVGLICDDQLFIRSTTEGNALIEDPVFQPPYKGAKPYLLIDQTDDIELLRNLILTTEQALPFPKEKKKKVLHE